MLRKEKRNEILARLEKKYRNTKTALNYHSPFELLVAVILSAQCTDKRVNLVTPILFQKFNTVYDFATAKKEDVEEIIKPCGFYHNKAKNIICASKEIISKFNGELPTDINQMMTIPGVGMKTAKVVCADLYNQKVIAVDTHILRISNRIGLVNEQNPNKVSIQLEKIFDDDFARIHHRMVFFGRYHCKAIKPNCENCEIKENRELMDILCRRRLMVYKGELDVAVNMILTENGILQIEKTKESIQFVEDIIGVLKRV